MDKQTGAIVGLCIAAAIMLGQPFLKKFFPKTTAKSSSSASSAPETVRAQAAANVPTDIFGIELTMTRQQAEIQLKNRNIQFKGIRPYRYEVDGPDDLKPDPQYNSPNKIDLTFEDDKILSLTYYISASVLADRMITQAKEKFKHDPKLDFMFDSGNGPQRSKYCYVRFKVAGGTLVFEAQNTSEESGELTCLALQGKPTGRVTRDNVYVHLVRWDNDALASVLKARGNETRQQNYNEQMQKKTGL